MSRSRSFIGVTSAFVAAVVLSATPSSAATITFSNMVATWSDVVGGTNVNFAGNGTGDATIQWGTPVNQPNQSGYNFEGLGVPIEVVLPPSPTPDFVLGEFTHFNFPIRVGTSLSSVRLTIGTDVEVDGSPLGNYSFVYDVLHNETPNGANPCADGGANGVGVNINGCADNVSTQFNALSDSFQIGSDLYTLDIRGFLLNGNPLLSFWTIENQENTAQVLARVQLTTQQVPEPMTLALVGSGLAAAAWRRRRRA